MHRSTILPGIKYFAALLALVLTSNYVEAQVEPSASELKVKHTTDFVISGDGSATNWTKSDWIPMAKTKGDLKYESKAKLVYSDKGVYVLFHFTDAKITSTMKEDFANLWTEDVAEIFFWPEESARLYFEYEISPMNYELAILCPNFNGEQFGWRPWHYEGDRKTIHKTKIIKDNKGVVNGWSAEVFIPFALLAPLRNVPAKSGTKWRTNMYRCDYDQSESYWAWQKVEDNFHDIDRYGTLLFE